MGLKKVKKPNLGFENRAKFYREIREKHGLTQAQVADDLGDVHSQFVSNWERGLCALPEHSIKRFCYMYGVPKDRFKMAMMQDYGAYVEEFTRWVYSK